MTRRPHQPPTANENGSPKIPDPTRQLAILKIVIIWEHSPSGRYTTDLDVSRNQRNVLELSRLNESVCMPNPW
eukprot:CAMPEP_0197521310 /NCGR_PEP_ID=MMETSP1318-20131121/6587_1 /TAXON_ID=552666 /ORGANISM="Partenskyella glossopodia, Strain RCC365" /LENGTH=72 /DNA_ID=CAMNT_0043073237 /DNA_START=1119 /DNA_END=1334 /DNA_ORIENTATION=+